MDDEKTGKFGRIPWVSASLLLLLVWVASMALDDDRLCSSVPLCLGFAAVLLLAVVGMVAGARPVRPSFTCLFGLAAGLYFALRCVAGDMLSEIWRELPLIFAAFVFYGAGYLMAQRRGGGAFLSVALALGVLGNVVYFFLLREGMLPLEATGRPAMSLAGANEPGAALFTYPNFVGMFLVMAGAVLICRPFWAGWKGWSSLASVAVGTVGVVCSFLGEAVAPWGLLPAVLLIAWGLWAVIRLYTAKELGWGVILSGGILLVGLGVLLGELFLGNSLVRQMMAVDTHGRTYLWSCILNILPQVPWYGLGAGAVQWQLLPVINADFMPNYAHNEYLQAWVDYGSVGVGVLLVVLLSHLASGYWCLASEEIGRERRALVASCMLLLLACAACALFDFVWHSVGLVGLTAFACGVLASPIPRRREPLFRHRRWASGHHAPLIPVRPLGNPGAALCCMGCMALAAASAAFGWRLLPAWQAQWRYNALCHAGASSGERVLFLERIMTDYPDPELVDHYVTLAPPAGRPDNAALKEGMLRMALKSNPHQLCTVVMLADELSRTGRYAEAESLLRDHYAPGGLPNVGFINWPGYYGRNLLAWGHSRMVQGDYGTALSMMEYALNLWGHVGGFRLPEYIVAGVGAARNKAMEAYLAARRVDVDMLRAIGVDKDDSWKKPLHPGGSSALYAQWGNVAHDKRFANPYAKRSPLKIIKK